MADMISWSSTAVGQAVTKYEQARATLQDAYTKLDNAKQHMDRCYNGAAYAALCAKWVSIYVNVKTAENAIDKAVNGLKGADTAMTTTESENSSVNAALEAGSQIPVFL